MNKTPEKLAIQKAIVSLYLRKRRARKLQREYRASLPKKVIFDGRLLQLIYTENEAHNALESVKKVLWHNDWD